MVDKMPITIGEFSQIEYLTVFNTIIFGLVASEYFTGWGAMLRYRENVKICFLHLLWTIFSFLTLIQNWYSIWPRTQFINNNILYFIYSLVPLIVFYLISVVLFPNIRQGEKISLKEFHQKNIRALFTLFAFYFSLSISSSFVYEDVGNVFGQNLLRLLGVILSITAAIFHKTVWLQYLFLIIGYIGLGVFLFLIPR